MVSRGEGGCMELGEWGVVFVCKIKISYYKKQIEH